VSSDPGSDESHESVKRGIFDGFEAYMSVTDEEYRTLFASGLIVLDTNAIHNLYRYAEQTRRDFIAALRAVKNQLWVPHQVLIEFWRNRDSVMRDRSTSPGEVIDLLKSSIADVSEKVDSWAKRISLDDSEKKNLKGAYQASVEELVTSLKAHSGADDIDTVDATTDDKLLMDLAELLYGRVGYPLDDDERSRAEGEGQQRIENKLPPAYMDGKKPIERAVGDYLIWHEMLKEAKERATNVLFVTGDVKEDWWRIVGGKVKGPRIELFNEMQDVADVKLVMLRPESFLYHVRRLLKIDVESASIREVESVNERIAGLAGLNSSGNIADSRGSGSSLPAYIQYLHNIGAGLLDITEFNGSRVCLLDYEGTYILVTSVGRGSRIMDIVNASEILRRIADDQYNGFEPRTSVLVTPTPSREASVSAVIAAGLLPVWKSGDFWWSTRRGVEQGLATERFAVRTAAMSKGHEEYMQAIEFAKDAEPTDPADP
jgi:hypothetical protein